jgi:hypothetical protein
VINQSILRQAKFYVDKKKGFLPKACAFHLSLFIDNRWKRVATEVLDMTAMVDRGDLTRTL